MRTDSELMVITKSKDLVKYIFSVSESAPKKFRFSLIAKMQNCSLDIMESLILANEIILGNAVDNKIRKDYQRNAIARLKVLDAVAMVSVEQHCLLPKQYEMVSRLISDCIKLTGAWINSDSRRLNNTK